MSSTRADLTWNDPLRLKDQIGDCEHVLRDASAFAEAHGVEVTSAALLLGVSGLKGRFGCLNASHVIPHAQTGLQAFER